MLDMKGAMIAYNPCHKCENTQMCSMCEITYYRKMMGVNNAVTGKKNTEKEDHCEIEGCHEHATCGTPTADGYKRVCGKHFAKMDGDGNG